MLTFKKFMSDVFHLPSRVFRGLTMLVLGGYVVKEDNTLSKDKAFPSLLGLILEGAKKVLDFGKWIGLSMTSFLKYHEKAIASAFWLSLLIGGAAALTVAFWPAALAFVANFTIAGFSIASVVGAGYAAQVAATAAIAAAVTSVAVYTVATVSNFVGFVKSLFTKSATSANAPRIVAYGRDSDAQVEHAVPVVNPALKTMSQKVNAPLATEAAPVHTGKIFAAHAHPADMIAAELGATDAHVVASC